MHTYIRDDLDLSQTNESFSIGVVSTLFDNVRIT